MEFMGYGIKITRTITKLETMENLTGLFLYKIQNSLLIILSFLLLFLDKVSLE